MIKGREIAKFDAEHENWSTSVRVVEVEGGLYEVEWTRETPSHLHMNNKCFDILNDAIEFAFNRVNVIFL